MKEDLLVEARRFLAYNIVYKENGLWNSMIVVML